MHIISSTDVNWRTSLCHWKMSSSRNQSRQSLAPSRWKIWASTKKSSSGLHGTVGSRKLTHSARTLRSPGPAARMWFTTHSPSSWHCRHTRGTSSSVYATRQTLPSIGTVMGLVGEREDLSNKYWLCVISGIKLQTYKPSVSETAGERVSDKTQQRQLHKFIYRE